MSGTTPAQRIRAWLTHSAYVFRTARDPDLVHKVGPVDGAWQELRRSDLQAALDRLDAMALDAVAREKRVRAMEGDVARLRALEIAGVDNWEGWDYAMAVLRGEEDDGPDGSTQG
jgi:hypothetical protein